MAFPGQISTSDSGNTSKLYEYWQIRELMDSNPNQTVKSPVSLNLRIITKEEFEKAFFLPSQDGSSRARRFENVERLSFSNPDLTEMLKYFPEVRAFQYFPPLYCQLSFNDSGEKDWNLNDHQVEQIETHLPNLTSLDLSRNQGLTDFAFSSISRYARLKKLNFSAAEINDQFLKILSEGETLPNTLEDLDLSWSKITGEGLSCLSRFSALSRLILPAHLDFSRFPPMPQLIEFELIFGEDRLTEQQAQSLLKIIPQMTALKRLNLSSVGAKKEFNGDAFNQMLSQLPQLVELNISGNESVEHLNGIRELNKLERLDLGSSTVSDFGFLENLSQLKSLNISYVEGAEKAIPLLAEHIPQLEELDISSCGLHFDDCRALGSLKNLRCLKLTQFNLGNRFNCSRDTGEKVEDPYPFLSGLPALEILEMKNIYTQEEVEKVKSHCPNLRELHIFRGTVFFDENGEKIDRDGNLKFILPPDQQSL